MHAAQRRICKFYLATLGESFWGRRWSGFRNQPVLFGWVHWVWHCPPSSNILSLVVWQSFRGEAWSIAKLFALHCNVIEWDRSKMHAVEHLGFFNGICVIEIISCALRHPKILVNLWDVAKPHISNHAHFLKSRLFWKVIHFSIVSRFRKNGLLSKNGCLLTFLAETIKTPVKRMTFANWSTFKSQPHFDSLPI